MEIANVALIVSGSGSGSANFTSAGNKSPGMMVRTDLVPAPSVVVFSESILLAGATTEASIGAVAAASTSAPATFSAVLATSNRAASASGCDPSGIDPLAISSLSAERSIRALGGTTASSGPAGSGAVDCNEEPLSRSCRPANFLDFEADRRRVARFDYSASVLTLNRDLDHRTRREVTEDAFVVLGPVVARARQRSRRQQHPDAALATVPDAHRQLRIAWEDTDPHGILASARDRPCRSGCVVGAEPNAEFTALKGRHVCAYFRTSLMTLSFSFRRRANRSKTRHTLVSLFSIRRNSNLGATATARSIGSPPSDIKSP